MSEDKTAYRQIMKATSLFGSVQVVNIIISIIRSKVIAVLLGPAGLGIANLLNSSLAMISGITSFGIDQSAVKEISVNFGNQDQTKAQRVVVALKRLVWLTALAGAILMIVSSGLLSEWAFEDESHQLEFILISIALLFTQLANSRLAILQGFRKLRFLAKANLFGNFIGLVVTVPLYYFFRIDAIAPAIVIASCLSFVFSFYYSKKTIPNVQVFHNDELFSEGKKMLNLGISLSLSGILALVVAYIVRVFISRTGGLDEVGYYAAGVLILNAYVGLIFNAMATDYFPRLSEIAEDIRQVRKIVLEQAYIAILLITPIIVLFLALAPFIIELLYSESFLPALLFLSWGIFAMFFKSVSFTMGYVVIAKGDSKLFMKTAVGFNSLMLLLNLIGYYYWDLTGLGISFLIYYILHFLGVKLITKHKYDFYFENSFYKTFFICLTLCLFSFIIFFIEAEVIKYILMTTMLFLSSVFSFVQLDKKMKIKELIKNFLRKK